MHLFLLAVSSACQGKEVAVPTLEAIPTPEELYQRIAQAMSKPGAVYHSTIDIDQEAWLFSFTGTLKVWVDVAKDVGRQEFDLTFTHPVAQQQVGRWHSSMIIANGGAHTRFPEGYGPTTRSPPPKCHGANAPVSMVLGCLGQTEDSKIGVETDEYRGKPAFVLVTISAVYGSDETFTFTKRLYLDRKTFLPIALESQGTVDYGEVEPTHTLGVYKNDFVSANSLPAEFFDPASIGYGERPR